MPWRGLEPPSLAAYAPQAYAYTNSATTAHNADQPMLISPIITLYVDIFNYAKPA